MGLIFPEFDNSDSTFDEWQDPYPEPVIEIHEGFHIVRDDLLEYGSKIRFLDYMIGHHPAYKHIEEWVYGSCPAHGFGQVSVSYLCQKYNKKAVFFMANRSRDKLHECQKRGIALGGIYHWINDGMMTVTNARARSYAFAGPDRKLLPLGMYDEYTIKSIVKVCQNMDFEPRSFWSVGGSGTLNRGLQKAWPKAHAFMVQTGHKLKTEEVGRAALYISPYKFNKKVKEIDTPPFPSAADYDAKCWSIMKNHYKDDSIFRRLKKKVLMWNVAA